MRSSSATFHDNFRFINCNDIEHDGRVVNTSRDPPGQQSVYILPGNQEEETYRMTTFARFPTNSPVDTRKLAEYGFCYTGFKDRVKCFSCGVQVERWVEEDDPTARSWHFLNCEFYTGVPDRNRPAGNRLRLFAQHTLSAPQQRRSSPLRTVTRTPSSGSSSSNPSPRHNHPSNHLSNQQSSSRSSSSTQQIIQSELRELFPCQHAINPHMRHLNSRLATYEVGWQASRVRASPRELADSGLYYLGVRDKVKCWYCNGGLQNWDYNDEPWFEHAKWFPTCEYLLQRKGPQFVHRIVAQFPNLRRPIIRNPSRRQVVSGLNNPQFHGSHQHFSSTRLSRSQRQIIPQESPIQIIDPREEMRKMKKKVKDEMIKAPQLIQGAREMGFEKKQIRAAFKRKLKSTNSSFSLLGDLIESIVNHEGQHESESESEEEEMETQESSVPSTSAKISAVEEVRQLEEQKLCKICRANNVQVVFLPCGHLVSCSSCSPNTTHCPVCKVAITDRVRTYAS